MPDELFQQWIDQTKVTNAGIQDAISEIHQVDEKLDINHRTVRAVRRLGWMLMATLIVLLVVLALLYSIAHQNRKTFGQIKDCVVESGKCTKRNDTKTAIALKKIAAEQQRQHNELLRNIQEGNAQSNSGAGGGATRSSVSGTTTTTRPQGQAQPGSSPATSAPARSTTTTTSAPATTTTTRSVVCGLLNIC